MDIRNDQIRPITTDIPPAPESVMEIVRFQCKGTCTSNRCSCKTRDLTYTDLYLCSTICENQIDIVYDNRESDDDSDN